MAAYAQFGYSYPSANQLLSGVTQTTASATGGIPPVTIGTSASSPLSGVGNDASLSPSGGSATTGVTGATGPLSPGAMSQTSNNAGSVPPGNNNTSGTGAATTAVAAAGLGVGGIAEGHPEASIIGDVATVGGVGGGTSCCENGRPIMTDPVSGQTVCSCQYDSARLALSSYSRMPASSVGVYGTPYPSTEQNPYPSIGVDSSAFYSPLSNPYALKEGGSSSDMTAWTSASLQPTTGYYSYDPTLAAYGYGASYDLAARRKNATRESTATLKAWLNEHKKNPYPTKGEKIMLAIITKMTLTQVSTWFANARRRLKKENKMTWEPKNKTEDDDDAMLSDDEKEKDIINETEKGYGGGGEHLKDAHHHVKSEHGGHGGKDDKDDDLNADERKPENLALMRGLGVYNSPYVQHPGYNPYQQHQQQHQQQQQQHPSAAYYPQHIVGGGGGGVVGYGGAPETSGEYGVAPKNPMSRDCGIPIPASKPKIWSLADTVACKTPPPTTASALATAAAAYQGQQQQYYNHHHHQQLQQQQLQQQQQAHNLQLLPNSSSSNSVGNNNSIIQSQQPMQLQPHPAHSSPLTMMNRYAGVSPYSQIPTGYAAGPISSTSSSNSSSNTTINHTVMPTTPTTPPMMQQAHQQHQQHQNHHNHQHHQQHHQQQLQQAHQLHAHQYHHQQQPSPHQQRMGFTEIQPDTPPQTPPNMKLTNGNGSNVNPLHAGSAVAVTPTNGMCYSNSIAAHNTAIGGLACNSFVSNMTAARAEA